MSKATKIVLGGIGALMAMMLAVGAAGWFFGWGRWSRPTCYAPPPPPSHLQPAPKEHLRDELLGKLVETGKLPARVVIRARRSGRP